MRRYRHRVVLGQKDLDLAVKALAARLAPRLVGEVTAIPILGGAMMFAADLLRRLPTSLRLDFLRLQSYGDHTRPQQVPMADWLPQARHVAGKTVLLLDDILDAGRTLQEAKRVLLEDFGAAQVLTTVFLDKPARRQVAMEADDFALRIEEDAFLVGYGLDYRGLYRNLPYIVALELDAQGQPVELEAAAGLDEGSLG